MLLFLVKTAVHLHVWIGSASRMVTGATGDVQYTGAPRELQVLSDTRWASRYYACRNLWDRLPAVVKVLEELGDENSGERSVGARGILPQIDFQFIVFLAIFKKLQGDAKLLPDMLQSSSLDLAKAVDLVEALISTFVICGTPFWSLQSNVMSL